MIVESYIIGRLNQVADESGVNPLDDPEGLQEELVQFPQIIRFQYDRSGQLLYQRMNEEIQIYTVGVKTKNEITSNQTNNPVIFPMTNE